MMLADDKDAATAALKVGYESATQFNREYKRQFGEPPRRDISRMREAGIGTVGTVML
jgi:AraC-like DNA-binding protein